MSPALPALPKGIPDCLKKRQLLNDKVLSPDLCREYGRKFLELGWREDALEFFKKGGMADELEQLKAYALETGDAFLLGRQVVLVSLGLTVLGIEQSQARFTQAVARGEAMESEAQKTIDVRRRQLADEAVASLPPRLGALLNRVPDVSSAAKPAVVTTPVAMPISAAASRRVRGALPSGC